MMVVITDNDRSDDVVKIMIKLKMIVMTTMKEMMHYMDIIMNISN